MSRFLHLELCRVNTNACRNPGDLSPKSWYPKYDCKFLKYKRLDHNELFGIYHDSTVVKACATYCVVVESLESQIQRVWLSHVTYTDMKTVRMTSSNGNIFRVTGHLCGEFTGPGEFSTQRPVTRSFDVFFDLRLNKRVSKQSWGWWFETLSRPLWRHCNVLVILYRGRTRDKPFPDQMMA